MKDFETIYTDIIKELKQGSRPRIQVNREVIEQVNDKLINNQEVEKCLCILCHLRSPSNQYHDALIAVLKGNLFEQYELTSFLMEACQRHFIEYQTQSGNPIPPIFFKTIAEFLKLCPKKERLSVLQLIEFTGGKSIFFKKVIEDLKWGISSVFNKNDRLSIETIKRMEKSWPL